MKATTFLAAAAMSAAFAAMPGQASATHQIGHAVAGGIIGGIIGGAIANSQPRYVQPAPVYVQPAPVYVQPAPVYVQPGYSPHQAWCVQRYRSYNPSTDIYYVRPGVPAYCRSPYN